MPDFRLRQSERLKKRKAIQLLFGRGNSVFAYPVRLQWLLLDRDGLSSARAGFSVPRKKFKRAVDRNRIKRRMREAYRLRKEIILSLDIPEEKQLAMMLVYTHDEILPFDTIQKGMNKCLKKLTDAYNE